MKWRTEYMYYVRLSFFTLYPDIQSLDSKQAVVSSRCVQCTYRSSIGMFFTYPPEKVQNPERYKLYFMYFFPNVRSFIIRIWIAKGPLASWWNGNPRRRFIPLAKITHWDMVPYCRTLCIVAWQRRCTCTFYDCRDGRPPTCGAFPVSLHLCNLRAEHQKPLIKVLYMSGTANSIE